MPKAILITIQAVYTIKQVLLTFQSLYMAHDIDIMALVCTRVPAKGDKDDAVF